MINMIDTDKKTTRLPWTKIFLAFISSIIALFYFVSALGWFAATYIGARSGQLGDEVTRYYQSLNFIDHIIRSSQVLLIVVASCLLLFLRKLALKLILLSMLFSLVTNMLVSKWGISFIGGLDGLLLIITVYLYAYLMNRRGFLH